VRWVSPATDFSGSSRSAASNGRTKGYDEGEARGPRSSSLMRVVKPLPPPGSVDLVVVHDISAIAPRLSVTDAEQLVAERHATHELALRSRGARGLMRLVASIYLGCRPLQVPIAPAPCVHCGEPHGKPVIDGSRLQINLSHAGNTILVGISSTPVGVDVELETRDSDSLALSRRFYSSAEAEWVRETEPTERRRRFLRLWVRKEAVLKGTGEGLVGGLDTVPVLGLSPLTVTRTVAGQPSQWTVADVDTAVHPFAAVALAGAACRLRLFSLADLGVGELD
jgi:4'-phosphopantetheinyl transferase